MLSDFSKVTQLRSEEASIQIHIFQIYSQSPFLHTMLMTSPGDIFTAPTFHMCHGKKRNFAEMPQNESKEGYEYTCAKIGTEARPRTFLFHFFQCCSEFLCHPTQGVKQM